MKLELSDWIALGGAAVGLLVLLRGQQASAAPAITTTTGGGRLSLGQVEQLARHAIDSNGFRARPEMLVAMAWIESSFDPGAVGDDGRSIGLWQVQLSTAADITGRLGHDRFGHPLSAADLRRPEVSAYLAAAYVDWIASSYSDAPRFILEAYNGGPTTALRGGNADTRKHWRRYEATLAAYQAGQALPDVSRIA